MLFRSSVTIKGHLLQDDVLRRGESDFRVFQRAEPPGPPCRVLVEIELALEIAGFELGDILCAEIRHDIDIVGQPRLPIGERGDRTRHKIADAVFF
jgi:hypothetical protein